MVLEFEIALSRLFGTLPYRLNQWSYAKAFLFHFVIFINALGSFYYIYKVEHRSQNILNVIIVISMNLSQVLVVTGHMQLFFNRTQICDGVKALQDFDGFLKPKNVDKLAKRLEYVSKTLLFYGILVAIHYVMICVLTNCSENSPIECGYFIPVIWPFDFRSTPNRQLLCSISSIILTLEAICGCTANFLKTHFTDLIANNIAHLEKMVSETRLIRVENQEAYFIHCIKYHQEIIRVSEIPSDVIEGSNFNSFVLIYLNAGIITCFLLKEFNLLMFNTLLCILLVLVTCCFAGQNIENKSISLAFTVFYSIPWNGNIKLQKMMMMMLIRSQKSFKFPIGKFGGADLTMLLKMVKMQFSIIVFFRNAYYL